jgi:hypothetical protein
MRAIVLSGLLFFSFADGRLAVADTRLAEYGPFASTSPDSGTCGNSWATDEFSRSFRVDVRPNGDGTFEVVEHFRHGHFVTVAGPSPGACQTNPDGTVAAGVEGRMHGRFLMVVTGDYNPDAECSQATCGTTAGFVTTVFGSAATFTIPSFEFHYAAGRNGEWINASTDLGGNRGDITGSPRRHPRDGGDDDDGEGKNDGPDEGADED